ncbi:MAG: tetratricopeptide repeat protein [Oscillospiraceae bacterium]|nr:tetratricopeptide repeat protein [Oscillospiraceae bacterium]
MKKETFADKMAKKAFDKPDVRKSWDVHMRAFGPILEPAFANNFQARIHLTAALNHIANKNLAQALMKLKALQKAVVNDADKAALLFCFGLYSETAGSQEQMLAYYTYANQCGHRFYLPYLKVAKFYLSARMCQEAEDNFHKAIECFDNAGLGDADKIILGSAYTNLASCLTMQHRYEEAEEALGNSRTLCPDAPGRAAAEAVLCAVRGDAEKTNAHLEVLRTQGEDVYTAVKTNTDAILNRTDPMFFTVPVDEEKIAFFWQWFAGYEAEMKSLLDREKYDDGLTPVAKQLLAAFPFLEDIPNVGLGRNERGYVVELKDYYAVAIAAAYEKLLAACPADVGERWQFVIAH